MKDEIYHTTRDGRRILLKNMSLSHLQNTIKLLKKRAKEGLTIEIGGGSGDSNDMWYDEYILYGEEALEELNYDTYKEELERRTP